MARRRLVDALRNRARLCPQRQIARVEIEDGVHLREAEHEAPGRRDAAAAQACSRSARHDRDPRCRGQSHAIGDLRRRSGKYHGLGTLLERGGSIEAVRNEILGLGQDPATADDRCQSVDCRCRERHVYSAALTRCRCSPRRATPSRTSFPARRYTGGFSPCPTPGGVPVEMMSPGRRLMNLLK
jgi:hypothetical protein